MLGQETGSVYAVEPLTIQERLKRVFYAPRSSFEAVAGKEDWLDWFLPTVLVAVLGLVSHTLSIPVMDNLDTPVLQNQLQEMNEEQKQQFLNSMDMLKAQGWVMIPVGTFSTLVVVAFVLQVMLRSLFEVDVTFRQSLVIKGYASLVVGLEWLFRALLINIQQTPIVQTGMGWFVPQNVATTFVGRVLADINFFDLWQIAIIATGMSALGNVAMRKALISVLVLWGIYVGGGAAIATVTSSMLQQGMAPTG